MGVVVELGGGESEDIMSDRLACWGADTGFGAAKVAVDCALDVTIPGGGMPNEFEGTDA